MYIYAHIYLAVSSVVDFHTAFSNAFMVIPPQVSSSTLPTKPILFHLTLPVPLLPFHTSYHLYSTSQP